VASAAAAGEKRRGRNNVERANGEGEGRAGRRRMKREEGGRRKRENGRSVEVYAKNYNLLHTARCRKPEKRL